MSPQSDTSLRELLRSEPEKGWRAFLDQYTPLILGLIRRGGVDDCDEMMEVYVLLCEQLSARGYARLKQQDAQRGSVGGWLAVLVRHAIVDWVRSRKGRRRLFHAVRGLPRFEQRVFELYYWDDRTPSEIAELVAADTGGRPDLGRILDAVDRVQTALSDRHRADLLALSVRSKAHVPLDVAVVDRIQDPAPGAEATLAVTELNAALDAALARLPPGDAALVRLKYVEGLSNRDIEKWLQTRITAARLQGILDTLRSALTAGGTA